MKRKGLFYKIGFGIRVMKVYKNWFRGFMDYFGLVHRKIIYRLRNGIRYLVRGGSSDFGIINEVFIVKEYNKLLNFIKKDSVVIDIGAQIGVFSVYAGKLANEGVVFCYEPFEENFNMLEKNISLNKLDNVRVFKLGVAGRRGNRKLIISNENTGGHGFYEDGEGVDVRVITLKDIFEDNKIGQCDFLKMDCEGAEYEILMSTPKKYLEKIKSITMEYHDNEDVSKLKKFLEKTGFDVKVRGGGLGLLYAWRL